MCPKVSVIIPVFNTKKYLKKCVESVINQTYENIEIILVDDGSQDGSDKMCDVFADENKNVCVFHKSNGGLSSARNLGIECATGEYILFLDSDDSLELCTIEEMVENILKNDSDIVIPNSYYKVYENTLQKKLAYHFSKECFEENPILFALEILIKQGRARRSTAVLYNLNMILKNKIRYPLGRISEDFFFNLDCFSVAKKLSLYESPSLYNLKRSGSISSSYYENFFDTILEMNEKVKEFINTLSKEDYGDYIKGCRETLLYRNVIIFAINIMGDRNTKYRLRKQKCVNMFINDDFREIFATNTVEVPYFEGKIQRSFMKISYRLIKNRMYSLMCFLAWVAANINTV